jgi:DNA topoisomerase-1
MLTRKTRSGKIFYSCARYPDCTYAVWNEPINEPCPDCGFPMLTLKTTKRKGTEKICPQKECGYSEPVEATDDDTDSDAASDAGTDQASSS